nr:hypothetical protein [Candidatus Cloacimonadota bacterium]
MFSRWISSKVLKYAALIVLFGLFAFVVLNSVISGSHGYLRLVAVSVLLGSLSGDIISIINSKPKMEDQKLLKGRV